MHGWKKKKMNSKKVLKGKVGIIVHWSDCGEWQLSSVCLVIYPVHMSSLLPLMGADHVTIVTTMSHFCHDVWHSGHLPVYFQSIWPGQGINKSSATPTMVAPPWNLGSLRNSLWIFDCIMANRKRKTSDDIFAQFLAELWWWWRQLARLFAHRAHVSFHWFRVTELQRDASGHGGRDGSDESKQRILHLHTWASQGHRECKNCLHLPQVYSEDRIKMIRSPGCWVDERDGGFYISGLTLFICRNARAVLSQ